MRFIFSVFICYDPFKPLFSFYIIDKFIIPQYGNQAVFFGVYYFIICIGNKLTIIHRCFLSRYKGVGNFYIQILIRSNLIARTNTSFHAIKKKTGKGRWDPLPVAVYIFETETESCDPVSDYLTLLRFWFRCRLVDFHHQRYANRSPFVNACSSYRS